MKTLHVIARAISTTLSDNDSAIQGIYSAQVQSDVSPAYQAWGAIKAFYEKNSIEDESNFEISVIDPTTNEIINQSVDGPDVQLLYTYIGKISELKTKQRIRLVLEVDYELNGVTVDELKTNLQHLVSNGIGNGLLTGSSEAEVQHYTTDVQGISIDPPVLTQVDQDRFHNTYLLNGDDVDCFIEIGNMLLHLIRTEEGVIVDFWPVEDSTEPFATRCVLFSEIEDDICRYYDDVDINDVAKWIKTTQAVDFTSESLRDRAKWIRKYSDSLIAGVDTTNKDSINLP